VTESVALPPDLKGTGNVSEYRVYIVGSDGHFVSSVALECADDTEATEQTEQLVDGHDVELWQRARKIAVLKHKPKIQF
jgi:hypothetical protein